MAKKSVARKGGRKGKTSKTTSRPRGDQSRLDLKPLQRHIRRRIKELETGGPKSKGAAMAAGRRGESDEETIERLRSALETLEDICFPSMAIPI